jgi:hypothetical protein
MLSGRRKKDYADASAANALSAQAAGYVDDEGAAIAAAAEPLVDEAEVETEAESEAEEGETVAA